MLEQLVIDGKTVELPQTPSTAAWTYAGNRGHMPNMVVCYDQSRLSGAVMFRDDEGNQIGPWRVFCPIDNQEFADLVARLSLEYGGLELDAKKLLITMAYDDDNQTQCVRVAGPPWATGCGWGAPRFLTHCEPAKERVCTDGLQISR